MTKEHFLEKHIYIGLTDLNTGFDSSQIKYFNDEDFSIIIKRVKEYGIGIYGIEPWDMDNHYYDTKVHEEYSKEPSNPDWFEAAFSSFMNRGEKLKYSASYYIPKEILENN
ncbi:hypothetical protein ACFQ1Q_13810 [Winogradskyella litorisediminis]|uniref:Uncharacterized protein n=1 Tax=Winogradskyella litorisediminis TaxID=1156618 RepID=A0ABW3NCE8_9FLAO